MELIDDEFSSLTTNATNVQWNAWRRRFVYRAEHENREFRGPTKLSKGYVED